MTIEEEEAKGEMLEEKVRIMKKEDEDHINDDKTETNQKSSNNGEKKKRGIETFVSEDDDDDDEDDHNVVVDGDANDTKPKKKTKKLRVKPEKVREVKDKILEELTKSYTMGMTEVPLGTLAVSVGYKHPRSDAFADAMKMLVQEDGLVDKPKGAAKFTSKGLEEYVPKETPVVANPEEAMERYWKHFSTKLKSLPNGSGENCRRSAKAIWDELFKTGRAFAKKELVALTTYSMERSSGFEAIMKAFHQLKFLEMVEGGKFRFTSKLFPFGRPE